MRERDIENMTIMTVQALRGFGIVLSLRRDNQVWVCRIRDAVATSATNSMKVRERRRFALSFSVAATEACQYLVYTPVREYLASSPLVH